MTKARVQEALDALDSIIDLFSRNKKEALGSASTVYLVLTEYKREALDAE
jgi:hypothetical protein